MLLMVEGPWLARRERGEGVINMHSRRPKHMCKMKVHGFSWKEAGSGGQRCDLEGGMYGDEGLPPYCTCDIKGARPLQENDVRRDFRDAEGYMQQEMATERAMTLAMMTSLARLRETVTTIKGSVLWR